MTEPTKPANSPDTRWDVIVAGVLCGLIQADTNRYFGMGGQSGEKIINYAAIARDYVRIKAALDAETNPKKS
jgi:hypothetical protein